MALSTLIFALAILPEVQIFREYLQIPSVHPDPNYEPCVHLFQKQAKSLDLPISVTYPGRPDKPVIVISWIGTQPELPSIMLNSHMDVVPVIEDQWTYPPFGAQIDENGNIYGRGAQDVKGVGIQYLEAIRRLKKNNVRLRRSVHIVYVPDEEIGGVLGIQSFIKTKEFKELNIGFVLDEGMGEPTEVFRLFYGERAIWQLTIHCHGPTGHASLFLKDTAGEKLNRVTTKFLDFRQQELDRLEKNSSLKVADVTTINLTILEGGEQINVVPGTLSVSFDIRLAIDVSHDKFVEMMEKWCKEAGDGVEIEFIQQTPRIDPTDMNDDNVYWVALREALITDLNLKIRPEIAPFATDSRHLRKIGLPAFGFSPINNTPELQHANDEYLNVNTFLNGIEIYEKIILRIANVK